MTSLIRCATMSLLLICVSGSASWSQGNAGLPEFFGFYALDGGQTVAIYEGQGSGGKSSGIQWYSIPQNSALRDTRPEISVGARFVLFYSNAGEMIQAMTLYRLPYVRNIIETLPADAFSPPSRRVVSSPKLPLLAAIPELAFKLLAKPIPNQPQMVELVASPKLSPGLYVVQYSPSGTNGWFALFSVGPSAEADSSFCLDLILPGGPRGLFERANSELNSTVPSLASYRYSKCDSSGVANSSSGSSSASENSGGVSPTSDQAPPWTDQSTGLMWTRSDNAADLDFDGAVSYCRNLNRAGFSDWRLPEIDELRGIYDSSSNVPVNRPDLVALHIRGVPGPAHIKGDISISGIEISNTGKPPADLQTFDFGLGKVKPIKSNKRHAYMRALCVRKPGSQAAPAAAGGFSAPILDSPAAGAQIHVFPRRLTLTWQAVPDATSYSVEVDFSDGGGGWSTTATQKGITATSFTFNFIGKTRGRWHVCASAPGKAAEACSEWREFDYTI